MRVFTRLMLALLVVLCGRTSAYGGGGVTVHIANDGTDTLIVSLYDRNLRHHPAVLSGEAINGNASISITITADASGLGHLSWTARTLDPDMRRCGHQDKAGLNDGATVHVHADSRCGGR